MSRLGFLQFVPQPVKILVSPTNRIFWQVKLYSRTFGGDPVRDVGLHGTDVLPGIIDCDEEISGLAINVIVKLKSVEKGR